MRRHASAKRPASRSSAAARGMNPTTKATPSGFVFLRLSHPWDRGGKRAHFKSFYLFTSAPSPIRAGLAVPSGSAVMPPPKGEPHAASNLDLSPRRAQPATPCLDRSGGEPGHRRRPRDGPGRLDQRLPASFRPATSCLCRKVSLASLFVILRRNPMSRGADAYG